MRVAFRTLGCKVNQVESEQLKEEFIRQGYEIVDYDREADIYIINTCTVTHTSDRKSRSAIEEPSVSNLSCDGGYRLSGPGKSRATGSY